LYVSICALRSGKAGMRFDEASRPISTNLGVIELTIQGVLRHSKVTTTRKAYIKPLDHQVTAGMEGMEQGIRRAEAVKGNTENETTGKGQLTRVSEADFLNRPLIPQPIAPATASH